MADEIIPPEGSIFLQISGGVALVDEDLVEELGSMLWSVNRAGYAVDGRGISMHRYVNKTPKGSLTDHINRVTLDNRRCNLRTVTAQQNAWNTKRRKPRTGHCKSQYKCVFFDPGDHANPWRSKITISGKLTYLGRFLTEMEAARAYDETAKSIFGEFACLNFP